MVESNFTLGLLMLAYRPFVERFQSELFFVPLTYDPRFVSILGPDLLAAGVLLGAMGSYIGVRRFVRI